MTAALSLLIGKDFRSNMKRKIISIPKLVPSQELECPEWRELLIFITTYVMQPRPRSGVGHDQIILTLCLPSRSRDW